MKKIKPPVRKNHNRVNWLPVVIILLLFAAMVWVVYLFKHEKRFAVVRLYSKEGAALNLSKNYNYTQFASGNKTNGALLAEEGDLLGINNTFIFFNHAKNDSFQVEDKGDSLVFVNGKINSIIISGNENLLPWFRAMKASDIDDLETIYFNSKIPLTYLPYLKEIARLKPNTALSFEEEDSLNVVESYFRNADLFSPRFVNISLAQDKFELLTEWENITCIYLELRDSIITKSLPAMPTLKECIVTGDNIKTIGPSFFSKNKQLKKITITADVDDFSFLDPLHNLESLTINNDDNAADISTFKNVLGKLSVLIVSGNCTNINLLGNYKNLRWLGLPENTSQQQFNVISAQLNNLQVLEMQGTDSITSFSTLQQLTNLRGLVIRDTVTDIKSLYAMKDLRYLSVPGNTRQDSAYILALEKELPGCIIVPNSGACLGSGWFLLLVPVSLLLGFLLFGMQKKSQKANPHEAA